MSKQNAKRTADNKLLKLVLRRHGLLETLDDYTAHEEFARGLYKDLCRLHIRAVDLDALGPVEQPRDLTQEDAIVRFVNEEVLPTVLEFYKFTIDAEDYKDRLFSMVDHILKNYPAPPPEEMDSPY